MRDNGVRALAAARQHSEDIKRLIAQMPRGTTRVQITAVCKGTGGERGCGKRWEKCFDLRDRMAPEGFSALVREARIHENLYEHLGCIDVRIDPR